MIRRDQAAEDAGDYAAGFAAEDAAEEMDWKHDGSVMTHVSGNSTPANPTTRTRRLNLIRHCPRIMTQVVSNPSSRVSSRVSS